MWIHRFLSWARSLSIAAQVGLVFSLLMGLLFTCMTWVIQHQIEDMVSIHTDSMGQSMALQLAQSAAEPLLAEDRNNLQLLVNQLVQPESITQVALFDQQEKIIISASAPFSRLPSSSSSSSSSTGPQTSLQFFRSPIEFQGTNVGYAEIGLDKKPLKQRMLQSLRQMATATIAVMLLGLICAFWLAKHLTKPIKKLIHASKQVAKGDLSHTIETRRRDEMGDLITQFNGMTQGLAEKEKMRSTFTRYVDPEIAQQILSNPDVPEIPIHSSYTSILFIDLVGFTHMCERIPTAKVASLLNDYYQLISHTCNKHQGTLDKFMGDGAMLAFDHSRPGEKHADRAIQCAFGMLKKIQQLNRHRKQQQEPVFDVRMGLHTGRVLAGSLGGNGQLSYTVIGDAVNIASRICSIAKPSRLLVSEQTLQYADYDYPVSFSYNEQLKGKSHTITLHDLQPTHRSQSSKKNAGATKPVSRQPQKTKNREHEADTT